MMRTKKRLLVGTGAVLVLGFMVLVITGYVLAQRFDPYIRQQAILYLQPPPIDLQIGKGDSCAF